MSRPRVAPPPAWLCGAVRRLCPPGSLPRGFGCQLLTTSQGLEKRPPGLTGDLRIGVGGSPQPPLPFVPRRSSGSQPDSGGRALAGWFYPWQCCCPTATSLPLRGLIPCPPASAWSIGLCCAAETGVPFTQAGSGRPWSAKPGESGGSPGAERTFHFVLETRSSPVSPRGSQCLCRARHDSAPVSAEMPLKPCPCAWWHCLAFQGVRAPVGRRN